MSPPAMSEQIYLRRGRAARCQGTATLASALRDEKLMKQELRELHDWVKSLVRREDSGTIMVMGA